MAMKPENVKKLVQKIERELDALESGTYAPLGIHWCCDKIGWLRKFGYIDDSTTERLVSRTIEVIEMNK